MPYISSKPGIFIDPQLGLPGIRDQQDVYIQGWYTSPYPLIYMNISISDYPRELLPMPLDADDSKIAAAFEARAEGAYKWQQLKLPFGS